MNKKIVIGIMLVLCASPFFCAGLKKGKIESKKPEGAHGTVALIKFSLQEWNPGPFNLPDERLRNLSFFSWREYGCLGKMEDPVINSV